MQEGQPLGPAQPQGPAAGASCSPPLLASCPQLLWKEVWWGGWQCLDPASEVHLSPFYCQALPSRAPQSRQPQPQAAWGGERGRKGQWVSCRFVSQGLHLGSG